MKRWLVASLTLAAGVAAAQPAPDARGVTTRIRVEESGVGHIDELRGKIKMRAAELVIAPGGHLGAHHHAGPGIRYVAAGELTFMQGGKAIVYRTGDFFYESGDIVHTAHNNGKVAVRVIMFEVLPASWSGASAIVPRPH
jgi:quercetin dioxygenase-like cupin family protein